MTGHCAYCGEDRETMPTPYKGKVVPLCRDCRYQYGMFGCIRDISPAHAQGPGNFVGGPFDDSMEIHAPPLRWLKRRKQGSRFASEDT